ncbi:sulfatase-like hydrolase/transferase [Helicobacter sp. 11S02596-1]|uniref:phosphoethanolamine transferase n=1 Tax=Helicobacter sp. 11S02596-1 TaxID=1476194 RepID=UPI0015DFA038|nr:sulfatase-like hydrolase/transferase [Helicobacter sp. 11S02596-1]
MVSETLKPAPHFVNVGLDARLKPTHTQPKIFVLVIGESARAANFSLNGYVRDTNPYMAKLDTLVNFTNFYSCGVITAISIPCMLTNYTHQTYKSRNQSLYIDNILDIAQRAGYQTYWISNNGGGCMGDVCARIGNVSYYNDGRLDGAMLPEIEGLIKNAKRDLFIVVNLHGSHGASYYERYPKDFEIFSPVCRDKELQKCSHQSIVNAYDNSLVYTDYFLYQIVLALDKNKKSSVGMWYLSDHGESLGEYGQYMHGGLPYALSPDVQKHIPSMIWLGRGFEKDYKKLLANKDKPLNQDYLFDTLLDLLDIQTKDYQKELDIANQ